MIRFSIREAFFLAFRMEFSFLVKSQIQLSPIRNARILKSTLALHMYLCII